MYWIKKIPLSGSFLIHSRVSSFLLFVHFSLYFFVIAYLECVLCILCVCNIARSFPKRRSTLSYFSKEILAQNMNDLSEIRREASKSVNIDQIIVNGH